MTEIQEITRKKDLPLNYSNEITNILKSISFNFKNVEVLGSMSFRSMLYASDYDCYEVVNMSSLKSIATKYKKIIKNLQKQKNIYIGDIKIGQVDEWEVIDEFEDYDDYKSNEVERKIKQLFKEKVITAKEYKDALKLIKPNISEIDFIKMKKELRYHILRWNPSEIIQGFKIFRGEKITLEEAFQSKGLFKLDCIARIDNKTLQEVSIIYELRLNNRRLNNEKIDFISSISEAIKYYKDKGDWFKVCKRLFSLYNYKLLYVNRTKEKSVNTLEKLFPILNSDLGILYVIHGDIDIMIEVLENVNGFPVSYIKSETDEFINRLSNVYSVNEFIKKEPSIIQQIQKILKSKSKNNIIKMLEHLDKSITSILNTETKKRMYQVGLM